MKTCESCGAKMRSDRKGMLCRTCDTHCACGATKSYRFSRCGSCAKRAAAVAKWADPDLRAKLTLSLRSAGKRRWIRFDDLDEESFRNKGSKGRLYATYRDDTGRLRYIYRNRWRWIMAYGLIPPGFEVHHKDEDYMNDDLPNLELLSGPKHRSLHLRARRGGEWLPSLHIMEITSV